MSERFSSVARRAGCRSAAVLLFLGCSFATTGLAAKDPARWAGAMEAFKTADQKQPPEAGGVLFVGSSSIRMWDLPTWFPERPTVNRGFGGSEMSDAVHYFNTLVTPHRPRGIVVYAGDNDIAAGEPPETVAADFAEFVQQAAAQVPEAKIAYLAIKPSLARWDLWPEMARANALIADFAAKHPQVFFVDIATPMLGEDARPKPELFKEDGLHLNDAGYAVWTAALRPVLEEFGDSAAGLPPVKRERLAGARWPEFRGPTGDGVARDGGQPPVQWSESEGVLWRLPLAGRGWSSPVVWGDRAWVTAATPDGRAMWATAIDLASGKILWQRVVFTNQEVREIHLLNGYASPTPVTDGQHVWVSFGSYGTACLDAATGETLWQRRDLPCNHFRGPGSSPVLVDGMLIQHMDGFDYQYVVALDAKTGETVWRQDREIDYGTDNGDIFKAFSTPLLIEAGGRRQLISATSKAVLSYDPTDGSELWRVHYDEFSATARPLFDGETLWVNTGFGKAKLLAIDPSGSGDVTGSHVLWSARQGIGSKPSQLLHEGRIYNVHDEGVACALDAETGDLLWRERLRGKFSASPILAGGHVYFFDHEGTAYVLRPGEEFELVAENQLDDGCMASPVPLGDLMLVRTRSALYLLGER